jgi:hypothetical protein
MSALTYLDQWRCQSCGQALGRPNAACADATWHLRRRSEREARARLLALGAEGAWRAWEALTPPAPAPAPAEPSRQVSRAGSIARRTIDKEVYRALLNATWTHDVGTAGNLDKTPSGADLRALIEVSGRSQQALARALESRR